MEIEYNGDKRRCASGGRISWHRLERMFMELGELKDGERLGKLNVDEHGITYYVINEEEI